MLLFLKMRHFDSDMCELSVKQGGLVCLLVGFYFERFFAL